jgi:acyl carrier protein
MSDIRAVVREFILTHCIPGEAPSNLHDDTPLRTSGILDSMATLRLVRAIEDAANFQVEAHEVDDVNFGSIDRIVEYVEQRKAAG